MILSFSEEQAAFLYQELKLNLSSEKEYDFDRSKVKEILNYCMDVETEEAQEAHETGKKLSERGLIAVRLCDLITDTSRKH